MTENNKIAKRDIIIAICALLCLIMIKLPYPLILDILKKLLFSILIIILPSPIISYLSKDFEYSLTKCGGLREGGRYIGYAERGLIYVMFLFSMRNDFSGFISSISIIIAAKALFKFSQNNVQSEDLDLRACAEWYIFGTLLSIASALLIIYIALMLGIL